MNKPSNTKEKDKYSTPTFLIDVSWCQTNNNLYIFPNFQIPFLQHEFIWLREDKKYKEVVFDQMMPQNHETLEMKSNIKLDGCGNDFKCFTVCIYNTGSYSPNESMIR